MERKTPLQCIEEAAETFRQRNLVYGDNYLNFGFFVAKLFPFGLTLKTPEDWNRFGVLCQILSKISRYANNFSIGHIDSMHDIGVYAFMLESLDRTAEAGRSDAKMPEPRQFKAKADGAKAEFFINGEKNEISLEELVALIKASADRRKIDERRTGIPEHFQPGLFEDMDLIVFESLIRP